MDKEKINCNKWLREDLLEDMGSELTPWDALGRVAIQAKGGLAQTCREQDPHMAEHLGLGKHAIKTRWLGERQTGKTLGSRPQSMGVQECSVPQIIMVS